MEQKYDIVITIKAPVNEWPHFVDSSVKYKLYQILGMWSDWGYVFAKIGTFKDWK